MAKLKLDLHDIYNRGDQIEAELNRVIHEAIDRRIELVEIIHRIEKDDKNFGRIFVHFRF
jgi:DNA-nicking Smr family endonuclease